VETALNENERRVLGALLEKSMAQPDYYPMTENALVAACNQKQNRDPVMDLDNEDVWNALESLRERGLTSTVLPGPGARTKRFKHEVESHYGWQKRERAVMAELLLRGPQTAGELRTRCSRFIPFEDLTAVNHVIAALSEREPSMVVELPREPGRSAVRYGHTLYPEDEAPSQSSKVTRILEKPVVRQDADSGWAGPVKTDSGTQAQIDALQGEVAELHEAISDLSRRLDAIENRVG